MKEILEILQDSSRTNVEEIALRLGMDVTEVAKIIKDYEADGTIIKYHTLINWEKAGEETVSALIDVGVVPQRDVGFDVCAERIYRFPEVKSVYLMSGGYDLSVLIEGKTMKEVALFVAMKLSPLEYVSSTATHFVLKKYKQDGIILVENNKEDQRLVISP